MLLAAATALTVTPALASPASAAGTFPVFTNERNATTPGLEQYGAVKATVAYDWFAFTCDTSACYSNGGALPTESAYKTKMLDYISQFGAGDTAPVVLDFENIVVTKLSGTAATNAFDLWKELITWTHEVAPSAPVGMYGYRTLAQCSTLQGGGVGHPRPGGPEGRRTMALSPCPTTQLSDLPPDGREVRPVEVW
ncbi:hypothetical protein [Streptomyces sp. NBC_01236]|uniref:hypothetical protein n=1 Tax=Streptomyces sp. NBC_01236 TaxID=2903789 RepID=UPI002E109AD7|nr:hypothetical protein OG324_46530 [Streptomyces sp. NBC_01236]